MKTYDEIFAEVVRADFQNENVTTESPEKRAAKWYAKQWASEAIIWCEKHQNQNLPVSAVFRLIDRIDAQ